MKNENSLAFYSKEAAGYEATRYGSRYGRLFRTLQRSAVARALALCAEPEQILDVGSGTGQMLPELAATGATVIASDLTEAMLEESRRHHQHLLGVSFRVADANCLPYLDGEFDVVASSRFLHLFELEKQRSLGQEMARVVRPGGILIVDYYSADARHFFAWPIRLYRMLLRKRPENDYRVKISEARKMLAAAGLQVVHVEGIGNFLLVPFLWLPSSWITWAGRWLGNNCTRLSEQFLIVARKP